MYTILLLGVEFLIKIIVKRKYLTVECWTIDLPIHWKRWSAGKKCGAWTVSVSKYFMYLAWKIRQETYLLQSPVFGYPFGNIFNVNFKKELTSFVANNSAGWGIHALNQCFTEFKLLRFTVDQRYFRRGFMQHMLFIIHSS